MGSWASYTVTPEDPPTPVTTITVNFVDDGNSNINDDLLKANHKDATTLVLTGDWANKDLENAGKIVNMLVKDRSNKNVTLDLSACTKMICKVVPSASNNPVDWTSDAFSFSYSNAAPVLTNVQKETKYQKPDGSYLGPWDNPFQENGKYYTWVNGQKVEVLPVSVWGYYSNPNDLNTWVTVDENVTVDPNNPNQGTAMVQPAGAPFSLSGSAFSNAVQYLNGIVFPDHENFTAIPDYVFGESGAANLASATVGSNLVWIGKAVFKNSQLTNFAFGENLKVIGPEAFHSAPLTAINLGGCEALVAIKYEAFEECESATTVTFPSEDTFTFLGNDAFNKSGITSADMSMCEGITEFQSKGNNGSTFKTFANCTALTYISLPPKLTAIPDDSGEGVFYTCTALQEVVFNGVADFGEDEEGNDKLLNPFVIGEKAFQSLPLETITFADNSNLSLIRQKAFVDCESLTTVHLTGIGHYTDDCNLINPLIIEDYAFSSCGELSDVVLSNNVSSVGIEAFSYIPITEIHIPASVAELKKHSFLGCQQLTTVFFDEFDKSCGDCVGAATKVAGEKGSGGQGQGAFQTCQHITDVYINTLANLECDNNAFDQLISWGAGDAGANFATLHFPKEKTEHYVNLQHYLTDEIVTNPGKFHEWLEDHYDQAINPHKNGWYEFINSGPTAPEDGPEYQSIILRTFSDYDYAYLVPSGLRAYVVNRVEPNSNGQYEVTLQRLNVIPKRTGVILYGHPNGKTQGGKPALVLTPVKFLETGDPLFDQKYNEAGELVDCDVEYNEDGTMVQQATYRGPDQGAALCRANWNNLDEDHQIYKNYLEPILSQYGTDIKPYETVKVNGVNKVKFRNFALGRYTSTDYFSKDESTLNDETNFVGFFRMKAQSYKSGYAYLHVRGEVDEEGHSLPYTNTVTGEVYVSEYATADGGEILVKPDEPAVDLDKHIYPYYWEVMLADGNPYNARDKVGDETYNPKRWWDDSEGLEIPFTWREYSLSWGDRSEALVNPNQIAKYFGEFEENADGVVKIVIPADNENGEYYTLQGVRVANPTKGVYIKDGKKVIIK